MAKHRSRFVCQACGYESVKWLGRCPGCGQWNTMVEEVAVAAGHARARGGSAEPVPLVHVTREEVQRLDTRIGELNRVLGGGVVPGSIVLVGGDPGIGKSTLLLQMADRIAAQGHVVLYISGEESPQQTKLRAERLGVVSERLLVLAETDLLHIRHHVARVRPALVIIDSVQTVYHPDVASAPGSVAQVRECTAHLMRMAKEEGVATFVVGHVTKDGAIAGPKLLEHMVDAVLYFEGERHHAYRILRAVKNRFGSTNEIGIFEMKDTGLHEVVNPSAHFLSERPTGVAGSTVVASLEGTRPVLVEVQALVTPTSFATPRRMATGVDPNRVALLLAVLEKRVGLFLQHHDAYVNVAGGVRLDEPAVDLAVVVSVASSFRDEPTDPHDVVVGEVGLTGEVRGVSRLEQRVREAHKLGFRRVIVPAQNLSGGWDPPPGMRLVGVRTVEEALEVAFGR